MRTINFATTIILGIAFSVASCNKDGDPPVITFHEIGMENSKQATAGDELHLDAEVDADNKIEKIEIGLHPESDHMKKGITHEWEFDSTYTEFSGLRNTSFHKHIEIPVAAEPGDYHFHFTVTDMEGYQTEHEEEVEILAPAK